MAIDKRSRAERICALRDLAVSAAMRHGAFETSGEARLVVLRAGDLMVTYRTPFNPLPKLTESMKFEAALTGKNAYREPYGIEIWHERSGKVLSLGWRSGATPVVDGYELGLWEQTLADIAGRNPRGHVYRKGNLALASRRQPFSGEQYEHSGSRNRSAVPGRAGGDGRWLDHSGRDRSG